MTDVLLEEVGGTVIFHPMTLRADNWLDVSLDTQSEAYADGAIACSTDYASALVDAMIEDGIAVGMRH
jgi:hypothetical protein